MKIDDYDFSKKFYRWVHWLTWRNNLTFILNQASVDQWNDTRRHYGYMSRDLSYYWFGTNGRGDLIYYAGSIAPQNITDPNILVNIVFNVGVPLGSNYEHYIENIVTPLAEAALNTENLVPFMNRP